jgi:GTPase-associated protein 1, N-terminal domain type 2/GTPase-associated protein 1, middle domain
MPPHEQAFHTCCRSGLAGQPGFQFNAASPGLTSPQLDRLAAALAGYQPPASAPLQPKRDELSKFPIALRYRVVEDSGPTVSRTVYVGQEFRGRDGAPDSGRWGNYFSHIVLGNGTDDPFDGLLAIELWEAEHWTVTESEGPALEPLGSLSPGPLDLTRTMSLLLPARGEWVAQVIDAVAEALMGGPRVVLIEDDSDLGAAWVALVSYVLPYALVGSLSFSTFEGQPRYVDVKLCATTGECDVAFAPHEIGQRVVLLDVRSGQATPASASLLGRVAGALAQVDEEALAGAGRAVTRHDAADPRRLGAAMAVRAGQAHLARAGVERCAVLELLADWLTQGSAHTGLSAAASALGESADESAEEVAAWVQLHLCARISAHAEAPELVDTALGVLIGCAHGIGEGFPVVPADAPVRPPVSRLAQWLEGVTRARDSELFAASIRAGWRMGLVGQNAELDRQLALELVPRLGSAAVKASFEEMTSDPGQDDLLRAVVEALVVHAVDDPGAMAQLVELARTPAIERMVEEYVKREGSFGAWLVALHLHLRRHPEDRSKAVLHLATLVGDSRDEQRIRELYGGNGPSTDAEHAEMLNAYAKASRRPTSVDMQAAWEQLSRCSLADGAAVAQAGALAQALAEVDARASREPAYSAWRMASEYPVYMNSRTGMGPLMEWIKLFESMSRYSPTELPEKRREELLEMTTRLLLVRVPDPEHSQAFDVMAEMLGRERWLESCRDALCLPPFKDDPRYFADLFAAWWSASASSRQLVLEWLLPEVLDGWPPRRREKLSRALPARYEEAWSWWETQYPTASALSRTAGRLRPRRGNASRR